MAILTVTNNANSGNGSLRDTIAQAQSGDIIKFSSSLSGETIVLNKQIGIQESITLNGSDAPNLTISGGEQTNIFRVAQENQTLTVQNLTLADSFREDAVGGAIWAIDNSTINLENTDIVDHVSQGAAVHGQQGTVINVTNSTFDNNDGTYQSTKRYSTGAISLFGFGSLTVTDSVFTNNKGDAGGALHTALSDVVVENSVFTGNDSTSGANKDYIEVPGGGGAIYFDGASVPNDPRFTERAVEVETEGGIFRVSNSQFTNNIAAGEGGAILAYGYLQDRIVIEDSEIINNQVIENINDYAQGGGLRLSGLVEIDGTTIAENQSEKIGGGIYLRGEAPASISNSNLVDNQAVDGGAIYDGLWGSKIEIANTNFESNSATNEAGVFYSLNNRPVSFQNSQFVNNTPDDLDNVRFPDEIADIVYGSNSNNTIVGRDVDSYLSGLNGNDTIRGEEGNDYLHGGANHDDLFGGIGSDTLIGGSGQNSLVGGNGDDVFVGSNGLDLIEGGNGSDLYIIGDENRIYYNERLWYDHAVITDFEPAQDTIQLHGKAADYSTRSHTTEGVSGTGIFHNNGLVALVGDMSSSNFNLNAEYTEYKAVSSTTNNV